MKPNQSVTNRELKFDSSRVLISKTDDRGKITFLNSDFIEISGYSFEELMDAPHNIVRHPDMPVEAFRDLWATIKSGQPWEGLVKNRAKSGDHYWVRANVTPIREAGKIKGYISIRTAPARDQTMAADQLYAAIRTGQAKGVVIKGGVLVKTGLFGLVGAYLQTLSGQLIASGGLAGIAVISFATLAALNMPGYGPMIAIAALASVFGVMGLNWRAAAAIQRELNQAGNIAADLFERPLNQPIDLPHAPDFYPLIQHLRALKAKISYQAQEQAELTRRSDTDRQRAQADLDNQIANSDADRLSTLEDLAIKVERETTGVIESIAGSAQDVLAIAQTMSDRADNVTQDSQNVAIAARQSLTNAQTVSAASEELSRSIEEISSHVHQSNLLTHQTADAGRKAQATIQSLAQSISRISEVTQLIGTIASQTDLLALNATIEAARAGEAGKGFAVVASEVKNLANQTQKSTQDIERQVAEIMATTKLAVTDVDSMGRKVEELNTVATSIAAAMEEQGAATSEIARTIAQTAQAAEAVSERITHVSDEAGEVGRSTQDVRIAIETISKNIQGLKSVLVRIIRTSANEVDRRAAPRIATRMSASLVIGGDRRAADVVDISTSGARLIALPGLSKGQAVTLDLDGIGSLKGILISADSNNCHIEFQDQSSDVTARLDQRIRSIIADDLNHIENAKKIAKRIEGTLDSAVKRGDISLEDLFNINYEPIPNTDPPQFLAKYTNLLDRLVPPLIEPPLKDDPRVAFCAPVDRNCFLSTHNQKFSHPQRPDDPTWNSANCRNRRIFNDPAGFAAAHVQEEFLVQAYNRDMGGGRTITMKEVDVPIRLNGRHWGALRFAFSA
jgi:PAS domain S-box-containing protein